MQFLVGKQKAISLILTPWCSAKNEGVIFFTAFLKVDLIERQKSILKKKYSNKVRFEAESLSQRGMHFYKGLAARI